MGGSNNPFSCSQANEANANLAVATSKVFCVIQNFQERLLVFLSLKTIKM